MSEHTTMYPLEIKMNSELVEDIVLGWLDSNNMIPNRDNALFVDLGLEINEAGLTDVVVYYNKRPDDYQPYHIIDHTLEDLNNNEDILS